MDLNLILSIVSQLLTFLIMILSARYPAQNVMIKNKIKQISEFSADLSKAWEDDNISNDEFDILMKKFQELVSRSVF